MVSFNRYVIGYLVGIVLAFALSSSPVLAQAPGPTENLKQTVNYLLDFVSNSDCTFTRNGRSYSAKEAAAHIKTKYDYFIKEVKTAEDFIRLAASKSLFSGQPYLVKTKEGKEIKSADWLARVLDDYRMSQADTKKAKADAP